MLSHHVATSDHDLSGIHPKLKILVSVSRFQKGFGVIFHSSSVTLRGVPHNSAEILE